MIATDPVFAEHDTGPAHLESAVRLVAVAEGIRRSGIDSELSELPLRLASRAELERVHPGDHLDQLAVGCRMSRHFDADTPSSPGSWGAALAAAGAGLAAADALVDGTAKGAFLAVRPPGHHARPS